MASHQLPPIVDAYFAAKGESTAQAADLFAEDAVIRDLGEDLEIQGTAKIQEWLRSTASAYDLTLEVSSVEDLESGCLADVVATGNFPGSPYKFEYRFQVKDGKIVELKIEPIGPLSE